MRNLLVICAWMMGALIATGCASRPTTPIDEDTSLNPFLLDLTGQDRDLRNLHIATKFVYSEDLNRRECWRRHKPDYGAALACVDGAPVYWVVMARSDHAGAQYELGTIYNQGEGEVVQDIGKALYWWQLSATNGHADAKAKLHVIQRQRIQERLGSVAVAVFPVTSGTVVRKQINEHSQALADASGGEMVGSAAYGAMQAGPWGAGGVLIVGATIGLVEGVQQLFYHSRSDVRSAAKAIKSVLKTANIDDDLGRSILARLKGRTIMLDQPIDNTDEQIKKYKRLKDSGIDTLIQLGDLRVGLIGGSENMARFNMQVSMTVIEFKDQPTMSHQIIGYRGKDSTLQEWANINADALKEQLERGYHSLVDQIVWYLAR